MDLIKKFPGFTLFILAAVVHVVLVFIDSTLVIYSKSFLPFSLLLPAVLYFYKNNIAVSGSLIMALVLSSGAEYSLGKPGFAYLIGGVTALWLSYLLYIVCFSFLIKGFNHSPNSRQVTLGMITLAWLGFMGYFMTTSCLRADGIITTCVGPKLKFPLTIFCFTALWMLLRTFKIQDYIDHMASSRLKLGAIALLIYTGLLLVDHWIVKGDLLILSIMISAIYIVAQGLISLGIAMLYTYGERDPGI